MLFRSVVLEWTGHHGTRCWSSRHDLLQRTNLGAIGPCTVYWLVIQATVWHDIDLQVTGFSIGSGLLYALDTMCSQSFGAGNLKVRTIEMLCSGVCALVCLNIERLTRRARTSRRSA